MDLVLIGLPDVDDRNVFPIAPMGGHSGTQRLCRQGTTPFSTEIRIKQIVHLRRKLPATFDVTLTALDFAGRAVDCAEKRGEGWGYKTAITCAAGRR
jgi:hypothetical protein